jgi:hypothetical protein
MSCFRTFIACALFIGAPALACAEEMAPVALNSLSSAPAGAASAKVLDQNGHTLGQVTGIQTDQYGKPSALAFRASNGNTVVIGAAAVSFNGTVLVADNEQPQIAALTSARVASAN